jgi:hypothetical protein
VRKKVFVAAPYTGKDREANAFAAITYGEDIFRLGYIPFIPHFFHFWNALYEHPEIEWMKMDMEWLAICDAVYRAPGDSKGADREVAAAIIQGVPVFYSLEELLEKLPPR